MGMEHVSKRTYIVHSRAWYADTTRTAPDIREEIHVQYEKGDRQWEFSIRLYNMGPGRTAAFRVEIFEDAWAAFRDVSELFLELADRGKDIDVGEIECTLTELGFEDVTPEHRPDDHPVPMHNCSRCGKIEPV